jgi:steroid delta-isomerase-like uncharacterized protein
MPSENTQPNDNKQIVTRFMDECWSQGKLNTVAELVDTNCRIHDPVFPSLTSGADNLRKHIESCRTGFPDLKFKIDDTIAERNEVVVHWTATGTHRGNFLGTPPTNRNATVSGTSIFRIEGGKIVEEWAHWDLMSMMNQLGLHMVPENAQAGANASSKAETRARA